LWTPLTSRRWLPAALALLFGGALAGCAGSGQLVLPAAAPALPARTEIRELAFFAEAAHQCGPAALATVLSWSGLSATPDAVAKMVYSPALKGSLQPALVAGTRRHGRIAYEITGGDALWQEVAAGHPVIVLQNLGLSWNPVWHYAVVMGYDQPQQKIVLRSGLLARQSMSYGLFDRTWARANRWGMVVLPPSQLPATAAERPFVAAVIGLEKARQWPAAITGYRAALARWPKSLAARMGIGNSYYAMGDLTAAEMAFRDAINLHPEAGAAYNNLAHVLMTQGRTTEALPAARQAVALGGPLAEVYRQTLKEIRKQLETGAADESPCF
jgi:tetratricopeptide (TPR) repeat protein